MPIWSRSSREPAAKQAPEDAAKTTTVPEQDSGESAADLLLPWLQRLGAHAGADTLLHFAPGPANSIDLTHAHPSGLAQLLAGRRTRLSTLLRDPEQYATAMKAARALRSKIYELGAERGIDVGYLAAGTAAWRTTDDDGRTDALTAPVLLTAISLTVHASQGDYELQLTEQARLNPALVRHLRSVHDVDVDPDAVAKLAYGTARFDPHPVLDRLRTLTAGMRGINIEHHILVSTFADLGHIADDPAIRGNQPVLTALMQHALAEEAGTQEGIEAQEDTGTSGAAPADEALAPVGVPVDEREPSGETLILDADQAQQDVLDHISAGGSLVVSSPPGTGQTQTALNAAAALAGQGKSVLVVAERRGTLNQFVQELDTLNLGSLVLQLSSSIDGQQLRDQLIRAIVRNEKAEEPRLENLHQTLVSHRHQLLDHVRSLHNVRTRWQCSPYQAMQSLAGLTSQTPAPATTVRLKRSVLDSIADRAELTERLKRAAALGSFSKAASHSPWYGAKLPHRKETERAHGLAADLARDIPLLREKVQRVADHSQIGLGTTFTEWGKQLELLVSVRASLDKFTPDIFDRPVTDLISATAPSGWRRERSIEMSAMTRSRLRRVAKEYVRPGVHIADLHASLLDVQQQRTVWTHYATTERHPSVPAGLAEIHSFYLSVQGQLRELTQLLSPTPAHPQLESISLDELQERLAALVEDRQTLDTLPERTLLLEEMREHGLGELLDDLAEREVDADQVGSELELAWWQSALEAMISGDDYLAMSDGDSLRRLEAEYRLADNAHIASGAGRLRWALAELWRSALSSFPAEAEKLRGHLREDSMDLTELSSQAPELVTALMPVWAASPLTLPMVLADHKTFDAVIVLDADSISLQSAVSAIARGRQVIVLGDGQLGGPQAFSVSVETDVSAVARNEMPSAFSKLSSVLPLRRLDMVYRGVDRELTAFLSERFYGGQLSRLPHGSEILRNGRGLEVEYLPDGTGMPSSDEDGVESVVAEVSRVVELVFEHIRHRPSYSLAVVTASQRHADRIAEAVRVQMGSLPWTEGFFKPGRESFRVVPVDRSAGLVRDCVIFSLGFGRTPHGRALHSFGSLSTPGGRGRFVTAMTRSRHRLHVLTCFTPDDLDPARLSYGALDFYGLLQDEIGTSTGDGKVQRPDAASNADPLVADLVERLRSRGADVRDHYEGVLDIVATRSETGNPKANDDDAVSPMAIESDGTQQYLTMTVRERSRLRPQLLESMGWKYMPLWSIEVFTDPEGCADRVSEYLGLAKKDDPKGQGRMGQQEGSSQGHRNTPQDHHQAGAVIPTKAAEDDPRSWGEHDENRDDWLKEQRPPHWD